MEQMHVSMKKKGALVYLTAIVVHHTLQKQNQMLQRRHGDDSIEYIVSHEAAPQLAPMSVQVKSKGAGGPMRRKRKVKKHSSTST